MATREQLYIALAKNQKDKKNATKWGWERLHPPGANILKALGIEKVKKNTSGVVYGANKPRPPQVKVNFEGGGSTTMFCNPLNFANVTLGSPLRGKKFGGKGKYKSKTITSVTPVRA